MNSSISEPSLSKAYSISDIVKKVNECCLHIATKDLDDETFKSELKVVADIFREYFKSQYCALGEVDGEYVEDTVVSIDSSFKEIESKGQEKYLKRVKRARLDNPKCGVSKSLSSSDIITRIEENEIQTTAHFNFYKQILGEARNTTVIPIRDDNGTSRGYIQFINSKGRIEFDDIRPFYDSLLSLILIIHRWGISRDANLFKKDFDFFLSAQDTIHDVDKLLHRIMEYLSREFNAGIISFRVPLLVGFERTPLFYLRDCYIRKEVAKYYNKEDYFKERLVRSVEQMGGYDKLKCHNNDSVIIDKAKDCFYYDRIENETLRLHEDTLIIPILRDYSGKTECLNPLKNDLDCCESGDECTFRFAKYFGVFRLRLFRQTDTTMDPEEPSELLPTDIRERLSYLAKHISILMNSIVDKNENESLETFQKSLKGTSFTQIKDFDKQCSAIVKSAINAKACAIYRYFNSKLALSESTAPLDQETAAFLESTFASFERFEESTRSLSSKSEPFYFLENSSSGHPSIMIVPMIRKDKSKLGYMVLWKNENNPKGDISNTFWEHDKKHIELIVDVLTRIEESDSERLTFLAQLSHELLRPITEMVSRNDYYISSVERDPKSYGKTSLINEMKSTVRLCMTFKYIIDDVAYIYSLSKGDAQYNFEMADLKRVILDSVGLFEDEARYSKNIIFKTYLGRMPDKLRIDKSRMMQVIINLLRNAIRYSNSFEEIRIAYNFNEKKNCHEIDISDNGIPVKSGEQHNIFGLFYRSKNAIEKVPNGSGIGLYLVKQIMKAHNGDCYVKNTHFPTIFTIQIPTQ